MTWVLVFLMTLATSADVRLAGARAIYQEHLRRENNKAQLEKGLADIMHFGWWLSDGRYVKARHAQFIADRAQQAIEAGNARLIVCAPPRHVKSTVLSEITPSWFLTKYPTRQVIMTGYGDTFAETWGRKVRDTLVTNKRRLPVQVRGGIDSAAGDWRTTSGGGMLTSGVLGPILGRGADLFIIDDPVKNAAEAYSPTYQQRLRDWYQSTAQTRLQPGGSMIVTMQRWPSSDFVSWLIEQRDTGREKWELISLPAIAEADDCLGRSIGEALWPQMWPIEALEKKRLATEDESYWLAQYQQRPPDASKRGLAYHAFSSEHSIEAAEFDPNLPVVWSLDFNVDPMCSVIGQVNEQFQRANFDPLTLQSNPEINSKEIRILDEISLPNSTTQEATRTFIAKCEPWIQKVGRLQVVVRGDSSGHSRKSTGSTDYRVIEEMLRADGRFIFSVRAAKDNPAVRDRVTTVNNAFLNAAGQRRLKIHPQCKELRKDLGWMRWKRDVAGNPTNDLDKSNPARSHISDALGYLIWGEMKMKSQVGWGQERII